tara:strand:- start:13 stop:345 length:333 start_codon:yes stop_codon:yes gene_type:complete
MGTFVSPLLQQQLVAYDIKIPEKVLTSADRLSLKDLLDSPSFQCFFVSALGNGIQNFHKFSEVSDERDEFLMFRLDQLFKSIPYDTRRACFDEVGRLYRERREEREERRY